MRRLPPDPVSRRAVWASRCGWFAAAVAVMGVLGVRFEVLAVAPGFVVIGIGLLIALLALVFAVGGLAQIWRIGARGLSAALTGLFLALALLVWPCILLARGVTAPLIGDITTDLANPPEFGRSGAVVAARQGHVPAPSNAAVRDIQRSTSPDIQPQVLDMPADEAMTLLKEAMEDLGWQVIETVPPSRRGASGRIEAIQRSLLLRLPDDITIRVKPLITQTRIDIRSVSRYGHADFGANAARIRAFQAEVTALAKNR